MEAEAKEKLSEYDKELLEEKKKIQRKSQKTFYSNLSFCPY